MLHFASEIKALAASPVWNGDVDFSALEGYLSLGYFLSPDTVYRHVRKLEPGHVLRIKNGTATTRKYWDVEQFDTDGAIERRHRRGSRSASRARRRPAAGKRGADRRLSVGRHRLGLDRFLHGRGADECAVDRRRSVSPSRRTTSSELAALTAERYGTRHTQAVVEPAARRGARSDRVGVRRALRGSIGHPDLLRQPDGAPARDRGAFGRRRRRSVWRLRLPVRSARARSACASFRARCGRSRGRLVARRALAAVTFAAEAAAPWKRSRESRRRRRIGVLHRLVFLETGRRASAPRTRADTDADRQPGLSMR